MNNANSQTSANIVAIVTEKENRELGKEGRKDGKEGRKDRKKEEKQQKRKEEVAF